MRAVDIIIINPKFPPIDCPPYVTILNPVFPTVLRPPYPAIINPVLSRLLRPPYDFVVNPESCVHALPRLGIACLSIFDLTLLAEIGIYTLTTTAATVAKIKRTIHQVVRAAQEASVVSVAGAAESVAKA